MNNRMHEITLICGDQRYTRMVISDTTTKAGRIALDKMPDDITGPCAIICKPLSPLSELIPEQEHTPCAA